MTSNPKLPGARILIVDDEQAVTDLLCAILQDSCQCTTADSAETALKLLHSNPFDVVISDINMGGMSGLDLTVRVRELQPDAVVMVVSGSSSIESAIEAIRHGAFDFLRKPFEIDQVEIAVDRALKHAALKGWQRRYENHLEQLVMERAERLNYLAFHDPLTGLGNRSAFEEHVERSLESGGAGVIFVSLDNFKALRDAFGHAFGEDLLKRVGERLSGITDRLTVARFEGDEFALLSPGTDERVTLNRVEQIFGNFAAPFTIGDYEVFVSASVGVAISGGVGEDAHALLRNASAAVSHARQLGGRNFQFYTADVRRRAVRRLELENDLRRALGRGEMYLHYQPKLDTRTGRIVGAEALVRWDHPRLGLVPPLDFIPLAESSGLIDPIGEWILESACHQARAWCDKGYKIEMGVNLSPRQLQRANLGGRIRDILRTSGLEPSCLNLEVTEGTIMNNTEAAAHVLDGLRSLGVKISIDDFGTGYSSLGYLQKLPIDTLKIDRLFVQEVSANPDDAALIIAIITLAHNLGMRTVAEGVETDEQLKFLRLMRCDEWQGFLHSKPVIANEFETLLSAGDTVH